MNYVGGYSRQERRTGYHGLQDLPSGFRRRGKTGLWAAERCLAEKWVEANTRWCSFFRKCLIVNGDFPERCKNRCGNGAEMFPNSTEAREANEGVNRRKLMRTCGLCGHGTE